MNQHDWRCQDCELRNQAKFANCIRCGFGRRGKPSDEPIWHNFTGSLSDEELAEFSTRNGYTVACMLAHIDFGARRSDPLNDFFVINKRYPETSRWVKFAVRNLGEMYPDAESPSLEDYIQQVTRAVLGKEETFEKYLRASWFTKIQEVRNLVDYTWEDFVYELATLDSEEESGYSSNDLTSTDRTESNLLRHLMFLEDAVFDLRNRYARQRAGFRRDREKAQLQQQAIIETKEKSRQDLNAIISKIRLLKESALNEMTVNRFAHFALIGEMPAQEEPTLNEFISLCAAANISPALVLHNLANPMVTKFILGTRDFHDSVLHFVTMEPGHQNYLLSYLDRGEEGASDYFKKHQESKYPASGSIYFVADDAFHATREGEKLNKMPRARSWKNRHSK